MRENQEQILDFGLGNKFLNITSKVQSMEAKVEKNILQSKGANKKKGHRMEENIDKPFI